VVWGAGSGQLPEPPAGSSCRIVSLDQVCARLLLLLLLLLGLRFL
jgi:hypothetical protein